MADMQLRLGTRGRWNNGCTVDCLFEKMKQSSSLRFKGQGEPVPEQVQERHHFRREVTQARVEGVDRDFARRPAVERARQASRRDVLEAEVLRQERQPEPRARQAE